MQAEAALAHAAPGHCVLIQEVRSRAWLDFLEPAMQSLPDLGSDPIERLMARERLRGNNYSQALFAWLNTHGGIALAAELVGLHPNTLRYRLKRAQAVLDLDLDDPSVRLELHLRLRAIARQVQA
jgi:DNA-binding PucR family transcriptional regulator